MHRLAPTGHGDTKRGGDSRSLDGVEFAHTAGHEEALDKAKNPWNRGPAETGVENAEAGIAQIEVVNAKAAQKQRQQNANHLVAARRLILLIEDGLRVGIRNAAHGWFSCRILLKRYAAGRGVVPGSLTQSIVPHPSAPEFLRLEWRT